MSDAVVGDDEVDPAMRRKIWALAGAATVGLVGCCGLIYAAGVSTHAKLATPECIEPITLAAVGDVLLHGPFQHWAANQDEGFYTSMASIKDLLSGADVTVANLEGPAARNTIKNGREIAAPPLRYDGEAYSGYPLFNYHPSIASDLKKLGFDVLQTANNHAMDRGVAGVDRTLQAIEAAGLAHVGTRPSSEYGKHSDWTARYTVMRGAKPYTFGFVSCAYGTNGNPDPAGQVLLCYEQADQMAQPLGKWRANPEMIAQIRKLRADPAVAAVVVMPHWGVEYQPLPNENQMSLAQEMAEAGATAIIGTHPHVVEPEALLSTGDGRKVPVVYSLGNFVSNQKEVPRRSTLIYLLSFDAGADGKLAATRTAWIPLRMVNDGSYAIEALDRLTPAQGAPYREHLLKSFSAETLIPPKLPFWTSRGCPVVPH